jgi:hypothetical protein
MLIQTEYRNSTPWICSGVHQKNKSTQYHDMVHVVHAVPNHLFSGATTERRGTDTEAVVGKNDHIFEKIKGDYLVLSLKTKTIKNIRGFSKMQT